MNAITLQNQNFDLAQAVFIQNNNVKTDSLKVAKIFGKLHKNVIRAIENLIAELPKDLCGLNFELCFKNSELQNGKPLPYYEMTKDGFTILAMGFTGKQALQFKIAYINAFNHMAAILHNQHIQGNQFKIGSTVQLKIGSPSLYINQLIYSDQGYLEHAEIVWFKNRLHKEIVPIAALTIDHSSLIRNQILEDFWSNIYDFGIEKLNHSDKVHTIALNLNQVYQAIDALPIKAELTAALIAGSPHHPRFMFGNHAIRSKFTKKTVKCWIFTAPKNIIEHQEIDE